MKAEEVTHAINMFYEEMDSIYRELAKRQGLSGSAFDILYALYEQDGRRLTDLCKASFMSKQTLASSLKRLEEEGLVHTEAQSRRFVQVFLTDVGRARVQSDIVPVAQAEIRAIERLEPAERDILPSLLMHYLEALRAEIEKL